MDTITINALEEGTVLDHIPAGQGMRLVRKLQLEKLGYILSIGLNLPSQRLGKKDLIKVAGWKMSKTQASHIALFSPETTVSIVEKGQVSAKFCVDFPEVVEGLIRCRNPRCITQSEKTSGRFFLDKLGKQLFLTCGYCQTRVNRDEL